MTESNVEIGVLEEKENWLLHPRFFPSKVGGKPAWLDFQNIPNPADITCKICNDPMIFLAQVYAPYEEIEYCFHRVIFIFICRNGSCCRPNSTENFAVFRTQLSRRNDFYSFEPYEEDKNELFTMEKWPKLCELCGIRAPSHCSKCKLAYYCGRKHQILDWQKGHKQVCPEFQGDSSKKQGNNFIVTEAGKSLLFKEWEIIVDEEDDENSEDVDTTKEMEKLRKLMQDKKAGTLSNVSDSELEEYTRNMPEDKVFNKFSKRISRHPDQILRYGRGRNPLWITGNTENSLMHIPKCEYCDGDRQFEFQIMPQLLNFINVGIELNSIDWGVLAIYTCKASCNNGPSYKKEFMVKQDLLT